MKKYGNDQVWCELEDGWETSKPIEIWENIGLGHSEVIATCGCKFNAMTIIDTLMVKSSN